MSFAPLKFLRGLLAVVCLLFTPAHAGDPTAIKKLEKTPLFAFGGIGDAGTTSEGEIAFRKIVFTNSAESQFVRVLKLGNAQAECYALVGLRLKSRVVFNEQVKPFITSKQEVQTCSGCSMSKKPMSSVVAGIQRGNYDKQATAKPHQR